MVWITESGYFFSQIHRRPQHTPCTKLNGKTTPIPTLGYFNDLASGIVFPSSETRNPLEPAECETDFFTWQFACQLDLVKEFSDGS